MNFCNYKSYLYKLSIIDRILSIEKKTREIVADSIQRNRMWLHENSSYLVDCFSSKHFHTHINPKTMQEFYWSHHWFGWFFPSKYLHKWYFVSKIFLTYCEKNCSSDRENLFKFEAEERKIWISFEIIRTIYSNGERSENFW